MEELDLEVEKNDKYLPIGTVVLLKNAQKRMMITGFCCADEENPDKMYDYIGCLYPEGLISSENNLLFDHDQIGQIFALGFKDEEEVEFKEKLAEALEAVESVDSAETVA